MCERAQEQAVTPSSEFAVRLKLAWETWGGVGEQEIGERSDGEVLEEQELKEKAEAKKYY